MLILLVLRIVTESRILAANNEIADRNRRAFLDAGVIAVNIMGAPGAGKTTLIEALIRETVGRRRLAVIEGDLATTHDAERLASFGIPVVQIHTRDKCHLDAGLVASAIEGLTLAALDVLLIENVGNLICPASFRLGEHVRLVVLSATEGDDKVAKYPPMFQRCDAVAVTKADLLPYVTFDAARVRNEVRRLAPLARVFEVSARTGAGVARLADWLFALRPA